MCLHILCETQKELNMSNSKTVKLLPLKTIDWSSLVKSISNANSAIARYDGRLEGIVNPRVLLSPLLTKEAVLSSRIEGTQATLQEVLQFEADPKAHTEKFHDIQEIMNYRQALDFAVDEMQKRPVSLNLVKKMHSILLDNVRGRHKARGYFRKEQNWIGQKGCAIDQATYVPPAPEKIGELLSNWENYFHLEEKDRLVQLAIVHAQFELIHPFLDGNGRIGRILVPLFLFQHKVLASPMFYMSAFLEETREEYYHRLNNISQNNDWMGWIEYFLKAIQEQAKRNSCQAQEILKLYDHKKDRIGDLTKSRFAIQTLDYLFREPIFSSSDFIQDSQIPKASAQRILKCLQEGEVIRTIRPGRGSRPTIYIFHKLIDIVA